MDIFDYDDIVFPPDPLARLEALEKRVKQLEAAIGLLQRVSDSLTLNTDSGKWELVRQDAIE